MMFNTIPTWEWFAWLGALGLVVGLSVLGIHVCTRMVQVQRMRDRRFHAADQDQWLDDCE